MKFTHLLPVIAAAFLLTACGSDHEPPVSKGQQLNDLQQAYKNRAITDDEYEDQKEEILDQ
jgi:hypothetical protein